MKNGKVLELNKIAFVMSKGGGGGEIVLKWFRRIANVFLLKAKCQRINREPLQQHRKRRKTTLRDRLKWEKKKPTIIKVDDL